MDINLIINSASDFLKAHPIVSVATMLVLGSGLAALPNAWFVSLGICIKTILKRFGGDKALEAAKEKFDKIEEGLDK